MAQIPVGDFLYTQKTVNPQSQYLDLHQARKYLASDYGRLQKEASYESREDNRIPTDMPQRGWDGAPPKEGEDLLDQVTLAQEVQLSHLGQKRLPRKMEIIPIQQNGNRFLGLGVTFGLNAKPKIIDQNFVYYNVPC